jgi:hypothetical protein
MNDKNERVKIANKIIEAVSKYGRGFFLHKGRVSRFELADKGRLWYIDGYTQKRIYVAYKYQWRGFSEGGTLRSVIENLRDFIRFDAPIRNHFGPWPEWLCGGDLWGYGDAMADLRAELASILPPPYYPETVQDNK